MKPDKAVMISPIIIIKCQTHCEPIGHITKRSCWYMAIQKLINFIEPLSLHISVGVFFSTQTFRYFLICIHFGYIKHCGWINRVSNQPFCTEKEKLQMKINCTKNTPFSINYQFINGPQVINIKESWQFLQKWSSLRGERKKNHLFLFNSWKKN